MTEVDHTRDTGIEARPAGLEEIAELRTEYRHGADCQIVRDSILGRGLADPWLLRVDGEVAGYAGVWNRHFPDRILELFVRRGFRDRTAGLVRALAAASGATELEVQTNLYDGAAVLRGCSGGTWTENLLFEPAGETSLPGHGLLFRRRTEGDEGPEGDWVVEREGRAVAAGGWLTHYNPPYADLYMEVAETSRRQGVGAYLVQELRRACAAEGFAPAARCDPENVASRRTLERGGLRCCGEIVVGRLGSA